jgi:cysteine desulfurase/selenocysteine lyase
LTVNEDALLKLINQKTRLVALSMASNVLGAIADVKRVCEVAREAGALSVVDAAKAAGHLPIDVKDIGCDFLFFSGHKMCGPTGIGVLYGRKEHLDELAPGTYGGGMIRSVNRTGATFAKSPERFEAGTPPIAEAIGLAEATRYLDKVGLKNIHHHVQELVKEATEMLSAIPEVSVYAGPADKNAGVVSFLVKDIHPHDVAEILGRKNVAVRAGHHCAEPLMRELGVKSLTRASFSFYNTSEDIKKLKEAIQKAIKTFN